MKEKGRIGKDNECGCGCMWALVHLPLFLFICPQPCSTSLDHKGRFRDEEVDSSFCCYLNPSQFDIVCYPPPHMDSLSLSLSS